MPPQGTATLIEGGARVDKVGGGAPVELRGEKTLLCVGSVPMKVPGVPFDGERIFDADSINMLGFLPKSVAVVGSGIVAIEYHGAASKSRDGVAAASRRRRDGVAGGGGRFIVASPRQRRGDDAASLLSRRVAVAASSLRHRVAAAASSSHRRGDVVP